MPETADGGKPPPYLSVEKIEKTNKPKKVQRAPPSGMYVKMKQRPASSKPPIAGNFAHQSTEYSGSIMVSNLVKQHKLELQSSERLTSGPEEAYKGPAEKVSGRHAAAEYRNRRYSENEKLDPNNVDWEREYGIVVKKKADDERDSIFNIIQN